MTRTFLCTILLCFATQASAATLYRWIEADGSMTFSPEPPAAGIDYDVVETGGNKNVSESSTGTLPAQPATAAAAAQQPKPALVEPVSKRQELAYAPGSNQSVPNGITAATPITTAAIEQKSFELQNNSSATVVGSNQKYNQCQDLKKRVVSLERRLRSKLSPDEVDNTVMAIVRYQNSFDQFCL